MSIVRMGRCASCGTEVLWLRAWGFGEPRPLELRPDPAGEVVIDPGDARHRALPAGADDLHRYRVHWPCPAVTPPHANGHAGHERGPSSLSPSCPTPTGTGSGTPRSRRSACACSTWSTAVLDLLEARPSFSHFLLDGQTAMVDDYLEIRPESEPRIRSLAGAGRLSLGPWHSQPDEFLVSGRRSSATCRWAWPARRSWAAPWPSATSPTASVMWPSAAAPAPRRHPPRGGVPGCARLGRVDGVLVGRSRRVTGADRASGPGYTNAFRLADDPLGLVERAADLEARSAGAGSEASC